MTVRAICGKADNSVSHHVDTAASLPVNRDWMFVFDDTQLTTNPQLAAVVQALQRQARSSAYFKG